MIDFFQDDSYPKIRRSAIVVAGIISFVAHYEVGIKLPTAIFDTADQAIIDPGTSLIFLWTLLAYLMLRFSVNYSATQIRFRADLGKQSDVRKAAQNFINDLENTVPKLQKYLNDINKTRTLLFEVGNRTRAATKELDEKLKDVRTNFDTARIKCAGLDHSAYEKIVENNRRAVGSYLKHACEAVEEVAAKVQQESVIPAGFAKLEDSPNIGRFPSQLSAESKSDNWIGWDLSLIHI